MQMLYNSDSFAVVQFDDPEAGDHSRPQKGGYEIVDKFARKEIYLQSALADSFKRGVLALVEAGSTEEAMDDFIAGFAGMALQPLVLH